MPLKWLGAPPKFPLSGRVCINATPFETRFLGDSQKNQEDWKVLLRTGLHKKKCKKSDFFYCKSDIFNLNQIF